MPRVHAHASTVGAAMCPVLFCNGRIYPCHSAGRDIASRDLTERRYNPISCETFIIARLESRSGGNVRHASFYRYIYTQRILN